MVGLPETDDDRSEVVMEQICLVVPVQPGRADDARQFMRELEASRKGEYARSEERIGITKEVWFLAAVAGGEAMVAYMDTNHFANALRLFSQSQDGFDVWFKRRLADATGVDLNDPPEMTLPELLDARRGPGDHAHARLQRRLPRPRVEPGDA